MSGIPEATVIILTAEERVELESLARSTKTEHRLRQRARIVLRQKWSRGQVKARFANMPPCLIGMEACVGAHHLSRRLKALGHDTRLMPARYVRPYSKGQKNDFRDAEAIAEAVQRPTMKFVATKTIDQLDLQALHRVRERLVSCQRRARQGCRSVEVTRHKQGDELAVGSQTYAALHQSLAANRRDGSWLSKNAATHKRGRTIVPPNHR